MANTLPQHIPALDGIRGLAACGVLVTHVAFQTGTGWAWAERFDYFVAVFFALSAFVLWRRRGAHPPAQYYAARAGRILPAYLVCVVAVLALLPDARSVTRQQIAANLSLTQVFWPHGLAPGLTHLWSLCIEVSFYVIVPALALIVRGRRKLIISLAAAASLGWAWLPFVAGQPAINTQIWPPAYTLWFAVGMLAAELEGTVRITRRWPWWILAAACIWLASREWFGPPGLVHPSPAEFSRRVLVGGIFAAAVVLPYALSDRPSIFETRPFQLLGAWSYSIFLWHVALLSLVFPLCGIDIFAGHFFMVLALTLALTLPVAAASYELVEVPARGKVRQAMARAQRKPTTIESPA